MIKDKNITINEVAREAGVSKGTVDRVIYNRGRVSKETAAKVHDAIVRLGYNPNLYASVLATRSKKIIACILPRYDKVQYWEEIYKGVLQGADQVRSLGIEAQVHFYDQNDEHTFMQACDEVLDSKPAAVMFHPVFSTAAADFSRTLHEKNIPYGYVDGRLNDPDYLIYSGTDLYRSGVFGAYLLSLKGDMDEVLLLDLVRDDRADTTSFRRDGFCHYMHENHPSTVIHTMLVNPDDPAGTDVALGEFFSAHPLVNRIIMTSSRVFLLANYMAEHPMPGRLLIGYDDIPANKKVLADSLVDMLVVRDIAGQSYNVVLALAYYVLQGKVPAERDVYMHLGMLSRHNLDK